MERWLRMGLLVLGVTMALLLPAHPAFAAESGSSMAVGQGLALVAHPLQAGSGLRLANPFASAAQGPDYNIPQACGSAGSSCPAPKGGGLSPSTKNTLGKISDVLNGAAATAAIVAGVATLASAGPQAPATVTVAAVAGIVGGTLWLGASVLSYMSRDPIDRHFKAIFKPVFPHLPSLPTSTPNAAGAMPAINRLIHGESRLFELGIGFITSLNRADGAQAAHNLTWVKKQQRAAAKFARQAATLLNSFPSLRSQIQAALTSAGVSFTTTSSQAGQAQQQLAAQGLPASFTNLLRGQLGVYPGRAARRLENKILAGAALSTAVAGASPAAINFPGILSDPSLSLADQRAASALVGYANSVGKSHRR